MNIWSVTAGHVSPLTLRCASTYYTGCFFKWWTGRRKVESGVAVCRPTIKESPSSFRQP